MYIQLASQVINYERTGEGEPLVLLHGNGEDHTIFDELAAELRGEYEIYALDTRGHGESATPAEYHYADMAEDVANFIAYYEIKAPTVLGFSDGGIIALLTAIRFPDSVGRLIVCGANTTPKGLTMRARHGIKAEYKRTKSPLSYLMLTEPDISDDELHGINCPTLVLAGENDMIRLSETKHIAETIPNASMRILKGEDHGSYIDHSAKLAPIIRELVPTASTAAASDSDGGQDGAAGSAL